MRRLRTRNYAYLIQRHLDKEAEQVGQRGQRNRGGRGTCVGVTGRTCAGDSRDNYIILKSYLLLNSGVKINKENIG